MERTVYAKGPKAKVTAELVIKDFLEVMRTSLPGKEYVSDTFMVGDTPMAISVRPRGDVDDSVHRVNRSRDSNASLISDDSDESDEPDPEPEVYVSVFLSNKGCEDISVVCQFITEAGSKTSENNLVEGDDSIGFVRFLSHTKCADVYADKDFVSGCDIDRFRPLL